MSDLSVLEAGQVYGQPLTFMGVPYSTEFSDAEAAILGCPFDCGTHPFRIGARQGPASIREQSGLVRRFQSDSADVDVLERLQVVDAGDVQLVPSRIEEAFAKIEEAARRIVTQGAIPVGFGGDGSVSLPLVRAAAGVYEGLVVLHVDSHTDSYPVTEDHPYNSATQFSHAALEQRIRTSRSYHIGLRGTTTRPGVYQHGRELGFNLISMNEFWELGPNKVLAELREKIGSSPVYLSWDMDVFDPSCAPGVCTPAWGGFSAREGLGFLRALRGFNIVAADVNTVSPPHDVQGMTAFLAATVTYEILQLVDGFRHDKPLEATL